LLFTYTINDQRARDVVTKLMAQGSSPVGASAPFGRRADLQPDEGYHRGSVWPHDNSLIAFGMVRSGYKQEASAIFQRCRSFTHFREYGCGSVLRNQRQSS